MVRSYIYGGRTGGRILDSNSSRAIRGLCLSGSTGRNQRGNMSQPRDFTAKAIEGEDLLLPIFTTRTRERKGKDNISFPETLPKQRKQSHIEGFSSHHMERNGARSAQPMHGLHAESDRHTQTVCLFTNSFFFSASLPSSSTPCRVRKRRNAR